MDVEQDLLLQAPRLPAGQLTATEVTTFLTSLYQYVTKNWPNSKRSDLRGNHLRREREAYQSYLFLYGYVRLFGLPPTLTIEVSEVEDRDVTVRWRNGKTMMEMRLQLKELPSPKINVQAKSAQQELSKILEKLPRRSPDLTVAIFASYPDEPIQSVRIPDHVLVKEIWVYGFTKDNHAELCLIGGAKNEHRFFTKFNSPQTKGLF